MESKETYMCDLKKWLQDTSEVPLEEMSDFFANRLSDYEVNKKGLFITHDNVNI